MLQRNSSGSVRRRPRSADRIDLIIGTGCLVAMRLEMVISEPDKTDKTDNIDLLSVLSVAGVSVFHAFCLLHANPIAVTTAKKNLWI